MAININAPSRHIDGLTAIKSMTSSAALHEAAQRRQFNADLNTGRIKLTNEPIAPQIQVSDDEIAWMTNYFNGLSQQ